MSADLQNLVEETLELTGAGRPQLLEEDAPVLGAEALAGEGAEDFYLIGLIGGKEVGKSALVNAVVGQAITRITSHGPGTEIVVAYAHRRQAEGLRRLLEREVPGRYSIVTHENPNLLRQVLLDLPDIDSHFAEHLETTRRMLRHMLYPIWIQSVEKYADQQPQQLLLRVAAGNAPRNFVFCLNKIDQVVQREGEAAAREVREDYAQRLGRLLKLDPPPEVYMVSAIHPGEYELPRLVRALGQEKSGPAVRQSRVAAAERRHGSLLAWLDSQQLPSKVERLARLEEAAADLLGSRLGRPLLEEGLPRLCSDAGYRKSLADWGMALRVRRWPLVGLVNTLVQPLAAAVRRNLGPAAGGGDAESLVAAYVDPPERPLASLVQSTFAQLQQAHPAISGLYRQQKLWDAMAAEQAVGDLKRRLVAAVRQQRESMEEKLAGTNGVVSRAWRWVLTFGAVLWFPVVQPVLEGLLHSGGSWRRLGSDLALQVVRLLGVRVLLENGAFLAMYFVALWLVLRWDTRRRVARLLEQEGEGGGLGAAVEGWIEGLLGPLRQSRRRIEELVRRTEEARRESAGSM